MYSIKHIEQKEVNSIELTFASLELESTDLHYPPQEHTNSNTSLVRGNLISIQQNNLQYWHNAIVLGFGVSYDYGQIMYIAYIDTYDKHANMGRKPVMNRCIIPCNKIVLYSV